MKSRLKTFCLIFNLNIKKGINEMKNNKFVDVFGDFMDIYLNLSLSMFNFLFFGEKDIKFGSEFQRKYFPKMRIVAIMLLIIALLINFKFILTIVVLFVGLALLPCLFVFVFGLLFVTYITLKEKFNK